MAEQAARCGVITGPTGREEINLERRFAANAAPGAVA
jgi:hypothetical protein